MIQGNQGPTKQHRVIFELSFYHDRMSHAHFQHVEIITGRIMVRDNPLHMRAETAMREGRIAKWRLYIQTPALLCTVRQEV